MVESPYKKYIQGSNGAKQVRIIAYGRFEQVAEHC